MRIAGGTAKRITKRIINFILVIWGVVTLSFCLQVFTGTDPAEMIVRKVNVFATEEQIQAVREELGLDAPFLERYTDYIKGVLTGDLGTAITNRQPVIEGSVLSEKEHCHHDHFTDTHPDTNWESCLEHAVKMGMGSREYELIEIK